MKLGDKVTASAVLWRRTTYDTSLYGAKKHWDTRSIKPREGLFLGMRTLSNGQRIWHGEDGIEYRPQEHFRAALVVFSERERPVLVPVDSLEFIA